MSGTAVRGPGMGGCCPTTCSRSVAHCTGTAAAAACETGRRASRIVAGVGWTVELSARGKKVLLMSSASTGFVMRGRGRG